MVNHEGKKLEADETFVREEDREIEEAKEKAAKKVKEPGFVFSRNPNKFVDQPKQPSLDEEAALDKQLKEEKRLKNLQAKNAAKASKDAAEAASAVAAAAAKAAEAAEANNAERVDIDIDPISLFENSLFSQLKTTTD